MAIKTVGVVGAGQMGNGIAHVAAQSGLRVVMRDLDDKLVQRGLATVDRNLQRGVDKGRMSAEDKAQVLKRIRGTTNLRDLADCDFVVEAVVENAEVKTALFAELDEIVREGVILGCTS